MTKRERSTPVEKVIRPIVEGQLRGFLKEHPEILNCVDWYKPRKDKTDTFVGSIAKRIVRDLTCDNSLARLRAALLEIPDNAQPTSSVVLRAADDRGEIGV
jgi:hypothetical protein